MNDFVTNLDTRLAGLSALRRSGQQARRPARRARRMTAVGTLLVAATSLALVVLSASDEQRLPVFGTPTSDASSHRGAVGFPNRPDLNYGASHRFATPAGPGFVIPSSDRRALCVALPDPGAGGAFGTTCSPVAQARRDGVLAILIDSRRALAAFVLPARARGPVAVTSAGATREVLVDHGVAVVSLSAPGALQYSASGRPASLEVPGPFPAQNVLQCPAPAPSVTLTPTQEAEMAAGQLSGRDVCE